MNFRILPLLALAVCLAGLKAVPAYALAELTPRGKHLVTPTGERVTLRGVNLGNWLLLEPWMLGLAQDHSADGFPDQATILDVLEERFGASRAHALMELYREHWLTPRDFEIIASFGFNAVRLPIHYGLLEDPDRPGVLRDDAFKWVDHGVEMAAEQGLYVILDLHGVPGGQSIDAPTGQVEQNRLWTDAAMQDRTVALWSALATRYAQHPAVAAYDVVNEPFGDFNVNISPVMKRLFGRLHDIIRAVDPDTLIYAPGTLQGIGFYGDPAAQGWTHVGFTEHAYPGLFGVGETSLAGHARFLSQWVGGKARALDAMDAPYLVGEFNVVFDHVGGPALMRRYFDTYNDQGWAATMWSYKIVKPAPGIEDSNWYMATNAETFDLRDLRRVDDTELERRFRSLSTMPLAVDDDLREALRSPRPPAVPLPDVDATFTAADHPVDGWATDDVGDAAVGGLAVRADGRWVVWGGGRDLFNRADEFRFVHQTAGDQAALWTRLDAMSATDQYAKAGVMLRESVAPDAAHVLLHALPDGRVVLAQRPATGEPTTEQTLAISGFPIGLGLAREDEELVARYTVADGTWREARLPAPAFESGRIGVAVLAHDEAALNRSVFAAPSTTARPAVLQAAGVAAPDLLQNGSFETVKNAQTESDQAQRWNRWGQWLNRQTDWSPVRTGQAILAYHHWEIADTESSGVWQDVDGLTPGARYTFEVYANLDPGQADGSAAPASVELRLETPRADGSTLTLATRTFPARDLATGDAWSRLTLNAPATGGTMRALLVVYPAEDAPRGGALKFDDVSLRQRDAAEAPEPN